MNIIERIEYALKKAKENVFEKHIPVQDTDIDSVLVDAMLAIKELNQQVSELHASRESLLEYKGKIESDEFVLVPREPTQSMIDNAPMVKINDTYCGEVDIFISDDDTISIYKELIKAVEK